MNIRPILNFYTSLFAAIGLLFFMFPKALDGQVKLVLSEDFNISANNKLADLSQAGGYNSPQFAIADLNNDGTGELFIYDRNTQRQFALNLGESGVQTLFKPNLKLPISDWFKLVDYNCDNIPDLLTGSTGAIAAYPGIYVDNLLQVNENPRILRSTYQLSTQTFEANIFVNPIDIPIARDMDNDGDIDILAFSSSGSRVEFHENVSTGCDLEFRLQSGCYGYFLEAEENAKIELGIDKCPLQVQSTPFLKHSGTTLFYLDQDRQLILGELEYDSLVQIQMEPDGMANDSAVSVGLFPLNNALAAKEFLAVYDGFNPDEIIVAPNTSGSSDTQEAVQRLKRNSKNNWENLDDNFLHNRMLDLGRNTNTTVFNSEGEIIVLAATQVQRNSQLQNLIYRFRLENKEQLHLVDSCEIVLPNNEIIYSISVSPISNLLYVGTEGGSIYKVDAGLISCNFESDNIQQLQGSSSSASTTFSAISATDINGDGLDDLIIGSRNGGMKLLLGKSSGGLENFSSIWEEINVQHPLAPNVFAKPSVFSYAGRDYLWNFS
ncbi:MAG: FG-GAP repeat protein, partial [Luteibaculum sp.]